MPNHMSPQRRMQRGRDMMPNRMSPQRRVQQGRDMMPNRMSPQRRMQQGGKGMMQKPLRKKNKPIKTNRKRKNMKPHFPPFRNRQVPGIERRGELI